MSQNVKLKLTDYWIIAVSYPEHPDWRCCKWLRIRTGRLNSH